MSYDFAVLRPEVAGESYREALAAAHAVFNQEKASPRPDPRLVDLVNGLRAAGAADENTGWVSVWPLEVNDGGVAVSTTYADAESNLVTLLRLAAPIGLFVVDLSSERVYPPAPGEPVGVMAGDGSRLGALTRERLGSLMTSLPPQDPWLVLQRDHDVYIQTYQQADGAFLLERRDGSPDRHFTTSIADASEVADRMWGCCPAIPTGAATSHGNTSRSRKRATIGTPPVRHIQCPTGGEMGHLQGAWIAAPCASIGAAWMTCPSQGQCEDVAKWPDPHAWRLNRQP